MNWHNVIYTTNDDDRVCGRKGKIFNSIDCLKSFFSKVEENTIMTETAVKVLREKNRKIKLKIESKNTLYRFQETRGILYDMALVVHSKSKILKLKNKQGYNETKTVNRMKIMGEFSFGFSLITIKIGESNEKELAVLTSL